MSIICILLIYENYVRVNYFLDIFANEDMQRVLHLHIKYTKICSFSKKYKCV